MTGYALHPEAFTDLDDIRQYIAEDSPEAADRLITSTGFAHWCPSPIRAIDGPTSLRVHCGSS